jgi:chromosome segregation ATPase
LARATRLCVTADRHRPSDHALDYVKDAFRNLVEPIGTALQAFEQENSDNFALRNTLAELRTNHETVRAEFQALEKKAAELTSDNQSLRRELALVQQPARGLESDRAELTSEVVAARAEIANLESQLAQETADARALGEANQIFAAAAARTADRRVAGPIARPRNSLLETDNGPCKTALDQTLAELALVSPSDRARAPSAAARARLEQWKSASLPPRTNAPLCAARDEGNERHQSEGYALNLRLEAMRSRAGTAEKLLSEVRQSLVARTEEIRVSDRKVVEATIARKATEKTVERLAAARDALDTKVKELEQARTTLTERLNGLSETVKARETSLAHAEQKIKSLTDQVDQLEYETRTHRVKAAKRVEDLNEALQRARVEFAVAQGALETTRRDYARLQRGLSAEQAVQQSGAEVDGPSDAPKPKEPSRAKNGKSAGRSAKAMEAKPDDAAGEPTAPR